MNPQKLPPLVSQIQIDFRSGVPIYEQVMRQIKRLVAGEILKPGDQLPTVRALAQELRINFNTVARAYRILDEDGVISTQQGRGTFILDSPIIDDADALRAESLRALAERYLHNASQLGASPDEIRSILEKTIADWRQSVNEKK